MKSFVLGLILGVVLGAVLALAAFRNGWDPIKVNTQAVRDTRVITMTPEQFPARCGKIISDKLEESAVDSTFNSLIKDAGGKLDPPDERHVTVRMELPDGGSKNVTAVFNRHAQGWEVESIGGYSADMGPLGSLKAIEELYPCTTKP